MSNPSKAKGTARETAAKRWLQEHGWPTCRRQPLAGNRDEGDLVVCEAPKIVAEVKFRSVTVSPAVIAEWLRQTETEAVHAGADLGVLIVAIKNRGPAEWDAWMPANDWALLLTGDSILPSDAPWPLRASLADWSRMAWEWADVA